MNRIILRTVFVAVAMSATTFTGCVTITNTLPTRDAQVASAPAPQAQHVANHSNGCCCMQASQYAPAYYGAYDPRMYPQDSRTAPAYDPRADYRTPQYYPQPVDPRTPGYYPPYGEYYPQPQVIYVPVPQGGWRNDDRDVAENTGGSNTPPGGGVVAETRNDPNANRSRRLGGIDTGGSPRSGGGRSPGGREPSSSGSVAGDRAPGGNGSITAERRADSRATVDLTNDNGTITTERRRDSRETVDLTNDNGTITTERRHDSRETVDLTNDNGTITAERRHDSRPAVDVSNGNGTVAAERRPDSHTPDVAPKAPPTAERSSRRGTRTVIEDVVSTTKEVLKTVEAVKASPTPAKARPDVGNNTTGRTASVEEPKADSKVSADRRPSGSVSTTTNGSVTATTNGSVTATTSGGVTATAQRPDADAPTVESETRRSVSDRVAGEASKPAND